LVVCIVGFFVLIDDHGETWCEFKDSKGAQKWRKGFKIAAMWIVFFGSLIATLALGWESRQTDKKQEEFNQQITTFSNELTEANEKLARIPPSRILSDEAIARINKLVQSAPKERIEILCNERDGGEKLIFAENISKAFTGTKFGVTGDGTRDSGLTVCFLSPSPDPHLLEAVELLFSEIGQSPNIKFGKFVINDPSVDLQSPPDVSILVGDNVIGKYAGPEEFPRFHGMSSNSPFGD